MKRLVLSCLATLSAFIGTSQDVSFDKALFVLPDVVFEQVETAEGFDATYHLKIRQFIDHTDPSKGTFFQRAFLSHRGAIN